jgi:hypothetical protein
MRRIGAQCRYKGNALSTIQTLTPVPPNGAGWSSPFVSPTWSWSPWACCAATATVTWYEIRSFATTSKDKVSNNDRHRQQQAPHTNKNTASPHKSSSGSAHGTATRQRKPSPPSSSTVALDDDGVTKSVRDYVKPFVLRVHPDIISAHAPQHRAANQVCIVLFIHILTLTHISIVDCTVQDSLARLNALMDYADALSQPSASRNPLPSMPSDSTLVFVCTAASTDGIMNNKKPTLRTVRADVKLPSPSSTDDIKNGIKTTLLAIDSVVIKLIDQRYIRSPNDLML